MFKYNEDTQLYWFNGSTFEPNINFELVGMLMGIAFYNNMFVDMPVVPACYKLLHVARVLVIFYNIKLHRL